MGLLQRIKNLWRLSEMEVSTERLVDASGHPKSHLVLKQSGTPKKEMAIVVGAVTENPLEKKL